MADPTASTSTLPPLNLTAPGSLSHLQWRAAEWLMAFGPLRPETVLDYFTASPFFDRTSNNATLRMQMQFSRGGMQGIDEEFELKRFVGTEYALVHAAPPKLFIIHKRTRTSPTDATTTAVYYVLNDNIYQGPSLYSVLNERLLTSIHHLSKSMSLIQEKKPVWSPTTQYNWEVKPPPASALSGTTTVAGGAEGNPAQPAPVQEGGDPTPARDEDDVERPATTFNPLLFAAIRALESNPPPIPADKPEPAQGASQVGSAAGTRQGTPAVGSGAGEAGAGGVNGSAEKGEKKSGIRIGPTGKRKPKNAA